MKKLNRIEKKLNALLEISKVDTRAYKIRPVNDISKRPFKAQKRKYFKASRNPFSKSFFFTKNTKTKAFPLRYQQKHQKTKTRTPFCEMKIFKKSRIISKIILKFLFIRVFMKKYKRVDTFNQYEILQEL